LQDGRERFLKKQAQKNSVFLRKSANAIGFVKMLARDGSFLWETRLFFEFFIDSIAKKC
jgi:hypothetical protein